MRPNGIDNIVFSIPQTYVISGHPKGKKASKKLKCKSSLDIQFEEAIERFDFRSPKPSEVQCTVQRNLLFFSAKFFSPLESFSKSLRYQCFGC